MNCCPYNLLSGSTLTPLPFPVRISILFTRISGPQTAKSLPQSPFKGQFFRWQHFALPSMRLIFLRLGPKSAGWEVTHQKRRLSMRLFDSVRSKNRKEQNIDDNNCCRKVAYFRGDYLELSLSLPESAPLERWFLWWPLARLAALTSLSSSDPPRREPRLRTGKTYVYS